MPDESSAASHHRPAPGCAPTVSTAELTGGVLLRFAEDLPDRGLVLLWIRGKVAVLREVDRLQQVVHRLARLLACRDLCPQVGQKRALRFQRVDAADISVA